MKTLISLSILLMCFSGIGLIFWKQELKYLLPTPIPENYQAVSVGQSIKITDKLPATHSKPILLHFFNPECPCSRFNLKHFLALVEKNKDSVDFFAVIPEESNWEKAENLLQHKVRLLSDTNQIFSIGCGVYASPQAVLLDKTHRLFYRGNYNKSRYCTRKESNFAEMAIHMMFLSSEPPSFGKEATTAYGCSLPDRE